MYMRYEVRTIRRVRTEEEKKRRHLYGDKGAKFSSRRMALGGGYNECSYHSRRKG